MPLSSSIVITDWVALTTVAGSWTTNTSYDGTFARINDSMFARVGITLSGAPNSTDLSLDIPNGEAVDETKLPTITGTALYPVGSFMIFDSNTGDEHGGGQIYYNRSSNGLDFYIATTAPSTYTQVDEASPITFANNDYISAEFSVPITGW